MRVRGFVDQVRLANLAPALLPELERNLLRCRGETHIHFLANFYLIYGNVSRRNRLGFAAPALRRGRGGGNNPVCKVTPVILHWGYNPV